MNHVFFSVLSVIVNKLKHVYVLNGYSYLFLFVAAYLWLICSSSV